MGEIIGIVDNGHNTFWDIPLLGTDDDASELHDEHPEAEAFVAIGDNKIRCSVTQMLREIGFDVTNVISRDAVVSPMAKIDPRGGIAIMPGAVVNVEASVGEGCIINTNASVDHEVKMGAFSHIAPGCAISGGVNIGEISWIGTGARVIEQISIGKSAIIGAGAVVVRNVDSDCTVVGVPAKPLGKG